MAKTLRTNSAKEVRSDGEAGSRQGEVDGGRDEGGRSAGIAARTGVSPRRAQQICSRYRRTGEVPALGVRGRPRKVIQGRAKIQAEEAFRQCRTGAARPGWIVAITTRIGVPHNTIHRVLKEKGMAVEHPKKSRRRERIRYARTHSNSLRHTDYKLLPDGRWFTAYLDDASWFISGYGVFGEATGEHALEVLGRAVAEHGRPASVMTDHGSQSCANESETGRRRETEFERRLAELGVRQILAGVGHPQTNGRLERFHGEIRRKIERFSGIDEFVQRHDRDRPHDSLDQSTLDTPARAFARKMPEKGQTVKDEYAVEEYLAG